MTSGVQRIADAFIAARKAGRAALMPYFTIGYPTLEQSAAILAAIAHAGADLIELGMPFSDPLADGPTIQRSTQTALAAGTTTHACLESVRRLRREGVRLPLLLMGYFNPILSFGPRRFVDAAAAAGADGLIIPDLPPEEAGEVEDACRQHGLALVYLLSPASTPERIRLVAQRASGFVYLTAVLGVTGARAQLADGLEAFVTQVRRQTALPLAVGFGISGAEQARTVGRFADGVIVGSALVQAAQSGEDGANHAAACAAFVRSLRA